MLESAYTMVGGALLGPAIVGLFGWVYTVGNRVTKVETEIIGLQTLINTRFDATDDRLDRIEDKVNDRRG